ncbi:sensor histidine kinase [Streptomyces vinaceus]|uniref:histidine kinase n=1 Tax=Streptomyces vinaceus TaxID=1960 RepID=A0A5J6JCJ0_STRVI|nr:HAMP domain-containing sensor histidine kinase [Streptomyces vinaceus]QEV49007.1 sensor histidine kinase [Streptomyces vinaceus]GHE39213.1 two-component sensor histidine kinase [Streptomyces vinaceus]
MAGFRLAGLSLRSRLVLLSIALVALGLAVSDTVVLGSVRAQLVGRVDQQLERYGDSVAYRVRAEGTPQPHLGRPGGGPGRAWLPSQYVVAFADADGRVSDQFREPVAAGDPRPLWPAMDGAQLRDRLGRAFEVPSDHGDGTWWVLIVPVGSEDPALPAGVVVAAPLDDVSSTLDHLATAFELIGVVVSLLLAAAGWFAVRAGLRPLRRIEETAAEISAGRPLSHRMPDASPRTETGRLTSALNGMLAQIESAFAVRAASEEQMRRFVADASHELRTPLAGIRGLAELYRMGALADEADVKRTMARIESEAVRLSGLVEDLLTLVRMDEQRPLELAPMDLRTLAVDALHDTRALDPAREVTLTGPGGAGPPGPAPVCGDEARLRQVIANLVGNAVAHTPAGSPVRIGVGGSGGHAVIEVADCGPGLTPEQAARVFERFYRVDASRSRQAGGGAGLGLAIASALVRAHGGGLELETAPGGGAVFRVRLESAGP